MGPLLVLQHRMGALNQRFCRLGYQRLPHASRALDGLVEYHNMNFIFAGRSEPERVETGVVSWEFTSMFSESKPLFGRAFRPEG